MSLRFIYGRAGSGKSSYCLNEIKSKLENGYNGRLILIVPEQYSLQAEKSLISAIGRNGIIDTEVLSFRRMAYRVFSEVGGLTFPHVDPSAKSMILSRVIDKLGDNLKVFGKAAAQKGFINTLSTMISEFKRYGVTPEKLENVYNNTEYDELLKSKLTELCSIYVGYEAAIRDRFRDSDDDLTLLAQKLEKSEQFAGAEIWIDEFSGFTPQEYQVILKLMQKAARVNISLCTDCLSDERAYAVMDVFYTIQTAAKKIMNMAGDAGITIESPVILNRKIPWRFDCSNEIAHLEKNLHEYSYSRYMGKTKDISVFASVNTYSEIEETAREILRLCRDEGFRYRDITVVSGNLDEYRKQVTAIFAEYGIPYFIDNKVSITVNPLVKLITAVFDLITGNWSYEAVLRYLKTGMTGISTEETDLLENYVLACGIRGSHWTQPADWTFRTELTFGGDEADGSDESDEPQRDMLVKINEIRRKVSSPLLSFRQRTKGRKKAAETCTAIFDLLTELGIPERIEQRISSFRASGNLAAAGEYNQVWNSVMGVLDNAVDVLGEDMISLERFGEILEMGFNECSIGLIPPSLDQVLVGSVNRSKNHSVKVLMMLGTNDGSFPSPNGREGILSDKDRETLRTAGVELSSDTRSKAFEDQFIIYSTMTTAGCKLKMSYAIADNEGRALRPSIIISRIKRIFPELNEYSNIIGNNEISMISSPVPTFEKLAAVMRRSIEGDEIGPVWLDVYRWYKMQDKWNGKCNNIFLALSYINQINNINPEKAMKLYGSPVYSSVSQFEKYVACPFSYFIKYGMKAKDRKIFTITPPDVGTFMHAVIERFSIRVTEAGRSWRELEKDWCDSEISGIVDDLLVKMQGTAMNSTDRYKSLTGRLKRVLYRTVWLIVEHIKRSSFEPVGYETVFGKGGDFPPITLELESGGRIYLNGRVDRIDAFRTENGTYMRIIDYKSGSKAFKLSDVYYGIQVQLITYLDAIEQSGGMGLERPILPGGMLYMKIDDPIIRGKAGITEEEIEKAIMRQMKMRGLVLADVKLIREMDSLIDGDSLIIPARINKGDVLGRSSAATIEQFEALRKFTRQLLQGIGEEMLKGGVSIRPYKKKSITSCMYCDYAAVCQFDPVLERNGFRVINDKEDSEVWDMIGMKSTEVSDRQEGDQT